MQEALNLFSSSIHPGNASLIVGCLRRRQYESADLLVSIALPRYDADADFFIEALRGMEIEACLWFIDKVMQAPPSLQTRSFLEKLLRCLVRGDVDADKIKSVCTGEMRTAENVHVIMGEAVCQGRKDILAWCQEIYERDAGLATIYQDERLMFFLLGNAAKGNQRSIAECFLYHRAEDDEDIGSVDAYREALRLTKLIDSSIVRGTFWQFADLLDGRYRLYRPYTDVAWEQEQNEETPAETSPACSCFEAMATNALVHAIRHASSTDMDFWLERCNHGQRLDALNRTIAQKCESSTSTNNVKGIVLLLQKTRADDAFVDRIAETLFESTNVRGKMALARLLGKRLGDDRLDCAFTEAVISDDLNTTKCLYEKHDYRPRDDFKSTLLAVALAQPRTETTARLLRYDHFLSS